ncbi:MAG TPA: hypothetical protein VES39_07065 [Rhodospirillales bacterium]|nr:hypothetical protein [Rhodospirillales bacterium]
MSNIDQVHRVVFAHQWQDLAEWVRTLDELADLTDDEIEGVTRSAPRATALPNAA